MKILIIDSQGGGLGKLLISKIKAALPEVSIMAVGTNSAATAAMIKAGAHHGATGENAIIVASKNCDIIIGPVGIVIANALDGEISPKVAKAVGKSRAIRILIPFANCTTRIVGTQTASLGHYAELAVAELIQVIQEQSSKGALEY